MRLYENSAESLALRMSLGATVGLVGFVIMMAIFAHSLRPLAQFAYPMPPSFGWVSIAISTLVALVLWSGVMEMNPAERKRRLIGSSLIIFLFGLLSSMNSMNHDLFSGNVDLSALRTHAEHITCTPSAQVGKGYTQLEPCMVNEVLRSPSFSSAN